MCTPPTTSLDSTFLIPETETDNIDSAFWKVHVVLFNFGLSHLFYNNNYQDRTTSNKNKSGC